MGKNRQETDDPAGDNGDLISRRQESGVRMSESAKTLRLSMPF